MQYMLSMMEHSQWGTIMFDQMAKFRVFPVSILEQRKKIGTMFVNQMLSHSVSEITFLQRDLYWCGIFLYRDMVYQHRFLFEVLFFVYFGTY